MGGRPDYDAGDVVLCVNATPDRADPKAHLLEKGRHYRAATVGQRDDGVWAVAFRELRSGPNSGWAFSAARFRKVRPASDDFTARIRACQPITAKEDAHA